MRAFASFLVVLVVVGAIGYAGLLYLRDNADKFRSGSLPSKLGHELQPSAPAVPAPRGPLDYHVLQDQGGEPLEKAQAAGLQTSEWAYLSALEPIQQSAGIEASQAVQVRGLRYDLCHTFTPEPGSDQYLEFSLGTAWDELHFGFGFSDTEPSDPTHSLAIELVIQVDGKDSFGPQRITPNDKPIFAALPVTGANRILLHCRRIGSGNQFKPILLDAFLKRHPAATPAASGS